MNAKHGNIIKRTVLTVVLFLAATLILSGSIPILPSSKPVPENSFLPEILQYLTANLFPIVFFIASLIIGFLLVIYGTFVRRIPDFSGVGNTNILLGLFVLVSGIWVLTDSQALAVFADNRSGILNTRMISFVSQFYASLHHFLSLSSAYYPGGENNTDFQHRFSLEPYRVCSALSLSASRKVLSDLSPDSSCADLCADDHGNSLLYTKLLAYKGQRKAGKNLCHAFVHAFQRNSLAVFPSRGAALVRRHIQCRICDSGVVYDQIGNQKYAVNL